MTLPIQNVPLMISLATVVGLGAMILARRMNIPGIVFLLIAGVAIGPEVLNVIDPSILGRHLQMLVGAAVSIILFEGGLQLNLKSMLKHQIVIRRLITSGVVLTASGAFLIAYLALGWDWRLCVLFSTLVIVTGPTVVSPLLKRIRVQKDLHSILQAEGILIDPVGALIAVIAFEVIIENTAFGAATGVFNLAVRLLFGAAVGFGMGTVLVWLLKRPNLVADEFNNIFTLGFVLAIFHGTNEFFPESGIMATTIAGITVGNAKLPFRRNMIEFKEQLTNLLIALLFIILTANIRLSHIKDLRLPGVIVIIGIIFVVRPAVIFFCTRGSPLSTKKKLFMAWLGPRGIVAAAVTSLFVSQMKDKGIEGGDKLQALVFLVIAVTVFVQGLTADLVAGFLKVRLPRDNGVVIIGSNPFSRAIGHYLSITEDDVLFIDKNLDACSAAETDGFRVVLGNAMETATLKRARVSTRRAVLALTNNEGINLESLRKCREISSELPLYLTKSKSRIDTHTLESLRIDEVFSDRFDLSYWNYLIEKKQASIMNFRIASEWSEEDSTKFLSHLNSTEVVPIFQKREKSGPMFEKISGIFTQGTDIAFLVKTSAEKVLLEAFSMEIAK